MRIDRPLESDWDKCQCGHAYLMHVHQDRAAHDCGACGQGLCEYFEAVRVPWWREMVNNFKRGWRRG